MFPFHQKTAQDHLFHVLGQALLGRLLSTIGLTAALRGHWLRSPLAGTIFLRFCPTPSDLHSTFDAAAVPALHTVPRQPRFRFSLVRAPLVRSRPLASQRAGHRTALHRAWSTQYPDRVPTSYIGNLLCALSAAKEDCITVSSLDTPIGACFLRHFIASSYTTANLYGQKVLIRHALQILRLRPKKIFVLPTKSNMV
jgi:hypothetical protein